MVSFSNPTRDLIMAAATAPLESVAVALTTETNSEIEPSPEAQIRLVDSGIHNSCNHADGEDAITGNMEAGKSWNSFQNSVWKKKKLSTQLKHTSTHIRKLEQYISMSNIFKRLSL